MALNVFSLITIFAGIYPATIVVISSISARIHVPDTVATSIPSENGKLIGCAAKYGLITPKTKNIPMMIPNDA